MAEYLLWENIKDRKLGVTFIRDYRDGNRKFDFYSEEAKLIIEVKRQQSLKKVADPYEEYAAEKGLKLLLIPIRDFLDMESVMDRINPTLKGEEVPSFIEKEALRRFPVFVSKNYPGREFFSDPIHVDVNMVDNDILDIEAFKNWQPHLKDAKFILEDGKYICGWEVEKMSKSKHNVVNPDDLINHYGADTFRLYEMFLGPLESHKPWDTKGIEGVYRFMKKLWRLFYDENARLIITSEKPESKELKILHQTIKKVQDDIERFSFNTAVSQFMICVNELTELKCHKKEILQDLVVLLASYAPHIAEELWEVLGNPPSISSAFFPEFKEEYIQENSFEYPVSFNGKMRFKLELPKSLSVQEVEKHVLADEGTRKWTEEKQIRKVIIVPNKIINIVHS